MSKVPTIITVSSTPSDDDDTTTTTGAVVARGDDEGQHQRPFTICSVNDYQVLAKRTLPKALYEYLASGTDDEQTLSENAAAWKGWFLRPRVLRPVGNTNNNNNMSSCSSTATVVTFPRTRTAVTMTLPLFVSPAGVQALCDNDWGEIATAVACGQVGIPFGLSQHSTRSIEEVAAATKTAAADDSNMTICNWYQAYILKDRALTLRLIQRAANAGYQGIFLTVDSVRFGFREADARNGFDALPPPHRLVNYDNYKDGNEQQLNVGGSVGKNDQNHSSSSLESTYNARKHKSWDQNSELMFDQNVSWDDVRWLKQQLPQHLPLVIKGIMTAEDAVLAVEAGADGIMVSNHGGRQLDGCLAAIDALPEVVAAVRSCNRDAVHVPVFLDGGVRRGTDILKALALGAAAVGIGKPVFFALSVGGGSAVKNMLHMFQRELEAAMALTGCRTVADITPALVTRHPDPSRSRHHYTRSKL